MSNILQCGNPECSNEVELNQLTGRPKKYCCQKCKDRKKCLIIQLRTIDSKIDRLVEKKIFLERVLTI